MKLSVFFKKLRLKIAANVNKFTLKMGVLPKKYLAPSTVKLIGPWMIKSVTINAPTPPSPQKKPHLLILRNKFYAKHSNQISTEELELDNTLRASNLATFQVVTYDHDLLLSPLSDMQLIAKCRDIRPDAIILSSWGQKMGRHPSIDALKFIRKNLKIPIAVIWWDTCSNTFWGSLQFCKEYFDVHIIPDNPNLHYVPKEDGIFERILNVWPPWEESLFVPGPVRDIPVSFLGQVSSYRSYRHEVIQHLVNSKVSGHFLTNTREEQVSHVAYANYLKRSKISLNFSYSVTCNQLKGRVFEVLLAGAMLLESENEQISELFTPMKDYVPFSSKEDLVEKIHYYLDNEDERIKIAEHGRLTAIKHYSGTRFWQLLLKKLMLMEM